MEKTIVRIKKILTAIRERTSHLLKRSGKHLRENRTGWIISTLVFFLLLAILWPSMFVTIQAGEAGVYYKRFGGGTVVDKVYGEGFHVVAPWDKMTVYNVRFQTNTHEMDVLTSRGMQVHVKMAIRYQPEYETLGVLHQKVGPDYFKKIIVPDVEHTIRKVVGKYDVEELYASEKDILQKLSNEAFSSANDKYLKIDSLLITKIEMPPKIKVAIEKKQEEQQLSEAYLYKLEREKKEAERRAIEARGIQVANAIIASSLSEQILRWKGIEATLEVSKSPNAKIVLFGSGKTGLPVLFDTNTVIPAGKGK
ncbi:MAG: prohibitin family protein [Desulfuromonadaceae bacterium]|nr:prohibitin family protein [Desulfuromonadaceae bacterium]